MAKKAPTPRKSVKSAAVSKKKAAVSPAKHTEKPVEVPQPTQPTQAPAPKREESPFEYKMDALRERFKGDAMNSDKAISCNLHLRTIELLEEILNELRSHR